MQFCSKVTNCSFTVSGPLNIVTTNTRMLCLLWCVCVLTSEYDIGLLCEYVTYFTAFSFFQGNDLFLFNCLRLC